MSKSMTFEDLILYVLRENSGGIKMTKLVTDIVGHRYEHPGTVSELDGILAIERTETGSSFVDALDRKLEEMEASGKLCLLNYAMSDGQPHPALSGAPDSSRYFEREKTFVHFPLERVNDS